MTAIWRRTDFRHLHFIFLSLFFELLFKNYFILFFTVAYSLQHSLLKWPVLGWKEYCRNRLMPLSTQQWTDPVSLPGKYILPTMEVVRRRDIGSRVTHLLLFLPSQNSGAHTLTHIYFKSLIQQKRVICFQGRISGCGVQMEGGGFAAALTSECELRFRCSISLKCPSSCIFNALDPEVKGWFLSFPVQCVRWLDAWLGDWDFTLGFCFLSLTLQWSTLQHWNTQNFFFPLW